MTDNKLDLNTLDLKKHELEEGEFVTEAILVLRSSLSGGRTRVTTMLTDGMDFIVARGLIVTAHEKILDGDMFEPVDEDDGLA